MDKFWENEIESIKKINHNRYLDRSFKKIEIQKRENIEIIDNNFQIDVEDDYYKIEKNKTKGIDANTDKKLRLGKINIDMKIDFHGLTLDEALNSLIRNINFAYDNNFKCLLVITGKGRGTPEGKDSIKSMIEKWLAIPEISNKIIKYTDAQQKDGGTGALYILLKSRK